jgi:hypothetical protein
MISKNISEVSENPDKIRDELKDMLARNRAGHNVPE